MIRSHSTTYPGSATLAAPSAGCRVTVVIPARDEAPLVAKSLAALIAQRGVDGSALPPNLFDVIVFANNCSDDTAAVVRGIAAETPHLEIFVVEDALDSANAHVGTARKYVMDLAAARFLAAGMLDGIIASTDSDTIANEYWIAAIVSEIRGRDAVAGSVTIDEAEQERLLAPVRLLYARELAYRRALAEVETLIDPLPEDPAPRHSSFVGASFAVTARCYIAAGGLPPLRRLEDLEFSRRLQRIDARVRHSPLVRATTSARVTAKVSGGFGTFIADLHQYARRQESFSVEHPLRTIEDIESRAALRRIRNDAARPGDVARAASIFNLAPAQWLPFVNVALPFGTMYERVMQYANETRRHYAPARIEVAIETLRAAAVDAKLHLPDFEETPSGTPDQHENVRFGSLRNGQRIIRLEAG